MEKIKIGCHKNTLFKFIPTAHISMRCTTRYGPEHFENALAQSSLIIIIRITFRVLGFAQHNATCYCCAIYVSAPRSWQFKLARLMGVENGSR